MWHDYVSPYQHPWCIGVYDNKQWCGTDESGSIADRKYGSGECCYDIKWGKYVRVRLCFRNEGDRPACSFG